MIHGDNKTVFDSKSEQHDSLLDTSTLCSSSVTSSSPYHQHKPTIAYQNIDNEINSQWDNAYISHIDHPSSFFVQLPRDAHAFRQLHVSMHRRYSLSPPEPRTTSFEVGDYCVARFVDNEFYRARICNIDAKDVYNIVFVDFGTQEETAFENLRLIDDEFTELPIQAVPCSLYGAAPLIDANGVQQWTNEIGTRATNLFEQFVSRVNNRVSVIFRPNDCQWLLNFVEILVNGNDVLSHLNNQNVVLVQRNNLKLASLYPYIVEGDRRTSELDNMNRHHYRLPMVILSSSSSPAVEVLENKKGRASTITTADSAIASASASPSPTSSALR